MQNVGRIYRLSLMRRMDLMLQNLIKHVARVTSFANPSYKVYFRNSFLTISPVSQLISHLYEEYETTTKGREETIR